ncbi:hypothetical protein V8G54_027998, partial [Vigna mungo]
QIVGLKAKGLHSHVHDSNSNIWLTKSAIYRDCLRHSIKYKMNILYLHNGLNKEEKTVAYVPAWLLLPRRFLRDRMTTEDVFINKILVLQGVDVFKEDKILCDKSNEIGIAILTCIGLKKTVNGWLFRDEEIVVISSRSPPTLNEDHIDFIPEIVFEKFVVE